MKSGGRWPISKNFLFMVRLDRFFNAVNWRNDANHLYYYFLTFRPLSSDFSEIFISVFNTLR